MGYTQPSPGIMTSEHHLFRADGADRIGEPQDAFDVRDLIARQHIVAGTTLVALLLVLVER
jgi:hypothetical protein